jgi:hypothetical protein
VYEHLHPWRHLAVAAMLTVTVALAALLAATVGLQSIGARLEPTPRITPILNPTDLPRLTFEQLHYVGAFRLPGGEAAGDTFASGGGPMAFNPAGPSLYIGARSGRIAEVSIPTPVASTDVSALPTASVVQPFSDPADGRLKEIASDGVALAGLLVYRGRLYGTASIYYDATNAQQRSHFSRPLKLSDRGATPMALVGDRGRTGFVAGYLALVPPEWQTRLGGPAITGQCCVPIVSRTSWGPAAFAWEPSQLDHKDQAAATPLLYYDSEHPTLGPWEGSNPVYGATVEMGGVVLPAGTRTALFIGRNGTGEFCYGNGTGNRALVGTRGADHEKYCYDPVNSSKSQHAYPYRYQMWAYDLDDWAAVKAGKRDPWEVKPYGVWPFELPIAEPQVRIGGVAYDPQRQLIYISQFEADRDGYDYRPLIHVYRVS